MFSRKSVSVWARFLELLKSQEHPEEKNNRCTPLLWHVSRTTAPDMGGVRIAFCFCSARFSFSATIWKVLANCHRTVSRQGDCCSGRTWSGLVWSGLVEILFCFRENIDCVQRVLTRPLCAVVEGKTERRENGHPTLSEPKEPYAR